MKPKTKMIKTEEIIELENKYNITLSPYNNDYIVTDFRNENCYELDENKKLIGLNLSENQISDLSFLSNLTSITHLNLSGNDISDITVLSYLIKLTYLNVEENNIKDISPLAELRQL